MPRPNPSRSLAVLALAGLAFSLAQTMIVPALGDMKERLGTDEAGIAWTLTGYLLAAAVATPVFGRLGDMFGKRRMLVISLGFFAAGCVGLGARQLARGVVAGRVLQGVGGGIFPLCFGIIRDEFPRERVPASIGLISAILGIGGGVGLVLGGVLADAFSYHVLFWLGAAMARDRDRAAELVIPESPVRSPGRVDVRGAVILGVGLVLPLYAIGEANAWGWGSARTLGLIGAGLVILALWVLVELRTAEPLVNVAAADRAAGGDDQPRDAVRRLRHVRLLPADPAARGGARGHGLRLRALGHRRGAADAARLARDARRRAAVGAAERALHAEAPARARRRDHRLRPAVPGVAHGSELQVMIGSLVMSIGIGFAFAAMPNLIVESVPPERTGEATGFNQLVRSVGSSLGSQISAAILAGSVVAGAPDGRGLHRRVRRLGGRRARRRHRLGR